MATCVVVIHRPNYLGNVERLYFCCNARYLCSCENLANDTGIQVNKYKQPNATTTPAHFDSSTVPATPTYPHPPHLTEMPQRKATVFLDRQRRGDRPLLSSFSTLVGRAWRVCPPAQNERSPNALHPRKTTARRMCRSGCVGRRLRRGYPIRGVERPHGFFRATDTAYRVSHVLAPIRSPSTLPQRISA